MTTTVIMNVVYFFFYLLLSSFFLSLIFSFAALPPRFLSMTPGENWVRWRHSFYSFLSRIFICPLLFTFLFISFLLSVLFPVLSPHLCEHSSTLCVCLAGLWEMDLISFRNQQLQHSQKINCRSLITHTSSTISTLDILWWKVGFCNVLHFTVRNYLLKQHHFFSRTGQYIEN